MRFRFLVAVALLTVGASARIAARQQTLRHDREAIRLDAERTELLAERTARRLAISQHARPASLLAGGRRLPAP